MGKRIRNVLLTILVLAAALYGMLSFSWAHSAKETLREEGIRYYRMGDYENATDCLTLALKQKEAGSQKVDRDIYYYLADGQMKQEDYAAAVTYYEKLLELHNTGIDLYTNLGICYEKLNKPEAALTYYKKAIACKEATSTHYAMLAQFYRKQNAITECKSTAQKGYDLLKKEEGDTPYEKGKDTETMSSAEKDKVLRYAVLAYLSGNYEDAYAYYKLEEDGGDQEASLAMGHCLAESGKYEEALSLLNSYVSQHGATTFANAKIAYCYMQLGQYEQAARLIDACLVASDVGGLQAELTYEKGVVLEKSGDFDSAYDCFTAYLALVPNDEKAKREVDFLITRLSDEKAAAVGQDNGN